MSIYNDPSPNLASLLSNLPEELFATVNSYIGYSPAIIKQNFPEVILGNEYNKSILQFIADLEGRQIDLASGGYPVAALLKKYNIPQKRTADGKPKLQSLDLQVKVLYRYYKERISEIDPSNKYHLSLDDLPTLLAYDKAFNNVQLWKKLPGGNEYLDSEQMRKLSLTEQASQLKAWIESHPDVVNAVDSLNLKNLKLTSIPEEIGLLTNLTRLNLDNNQISKIENLETLLQLRKLFLSNNQISKIENLGTLTQLQVLQLSNNQISKIENLETLLQLRKLFLSNNQISKIENLETFPQLQYLYLANNLISKIENLGASPQLLDLNLSNNQISKIENLGALAQLQFLCLSNNQISKIENLEAFTQLKTLFLDHNQISKIENLDACPKLRDLNLSNNQISKIENLDALTELECLDLDKNLISKKENLDTLTNLMICNI